MQPGTDNNRSQEPVTEPTNLWSLASQINWPLLWARIRYCVFTTLTRAVILIIYVTLIRDGLISLFDPFAVRLAKLPGLAFLEQYELTYRADLALLTSLIVFFAVSFGTNNAIRIWAVGDRSRMFGGPSELSHRRELLAYGMALVMMFVDLSLMYLAVAESDWSGGDGLSFSALLVSVLYAGMLVFLTMITIQLQAGLAVAKGQLPFQ